MIKEPKKILVPMRIDQSPRRSGRVYHLVPSYSDSDQTAFALCGELAGGMTRGPGQRRICTRCYRRREEWTG